MGNQPKEGSKEKRRFKRPSRHELLAKASGFKRQTFYALENFERGNLLAKVIGAALFILIILNAVGVFFTAQPNLDAGWGYAFGAFYTFSTLCFGIEYVARIWIADLAYSHEPPWRARLHYVLSPLGIIDMLSFLPNMIAWFIPMSASLRNIINVVRLVRLVKISRYMRGLRTIGRVAKSRRHEILASFLVVGLLVVVASVMMYEIEHPAQPDKFDSLLSGVYWAVTTITATGYGDLVPITPLGRIVGSIIMLLSVAIVVIPAGILSAGFVAEFQNARLRRIDRDLKDKPHGSKAKGDDFGGDDTPSDSNEPLEDSPEADGDGTQESEG